MESTEDKKQTQSAKKVKKKKKPDEWQELSKISRITREGTMETQRLVICRIPGNPSKDAGKVGRTLGSKIAAKMKGEEGKKWAFLLPPPPVDTRVDSNRTYSVLAGDFLSEMTTTLWSDLYEDKRFKGSSSSSAAAKGAAEKSENPVSLDFVWDQMAESFKQLPLRETPEAFLTRGRQSIANGECLASGVVLAKDIVNAPHNILNSLSLADTAQRLAAESPRLSCQILNTADCEQLGMGAYLAVARGSETPPQFIHLIYKPPRSKRGTKV